jgi:purine-nucleoside phosphorylase
MGRWHPKVKRTLSIRLQNVDVFYVPNTLGLKALRQNSIMCVGMELNGLHPQSCLYAQNTIGETLVFTDWVSKVLNENMKYPVRSCWNESVKNLERALRE